MRVLSSVLAAAVLTMAASGCGSGKDDTAAADNAASNAADVGASTQPASVADAKPAAPAAFAQCAACHSVEPGKMGVGPSLAGVYGTKSGEVAGYAFSDAMKKANLTWDDATLDTYLTAPMKMVPGTKMTFAGLSDPAQRKAVIEYLKTLK